MSTANFNVGRVALKLGDSEIRRRSKSYKIKNLMENYFIKFKRWATLSITGVKYMVKKAIIEISLVDESSEKSNDEIADEIFSEVSEGRTVIPWCKRVEKVIVVEA
jgi:thiamine pyrophosphokinase